MEISFQKLPQAKTKCTVKISAEQRSIAEQKALASLSEHANIKGFRKGKAPPDMVRAGIDPDDLLKETARVFLPDAVRQCLEQSKAAPILPPQVHVESQEPLVLSILFIEKPEVRLKKPEKITIEKKQTSAVEAKDIDAFLQRVLASHRTETVLDRPAQHGDVVYVESRATDAQDNAIKELSHPNVRLTVGSAEDFVPGISEHLHGMKGNDSKSMEARFPDTHAVPAVRGKKATVHVTVKSVAESRLPEITPEFLASTLRIKKTPDEFRKDIEHMLSEQQTNDERTRRENAFFDAVRAATTVDLAPELIEAEAQEMLKDLQERLQREGLTMEDWMTSMDKQPKDVLEMISDGAKKQLTLRLGLQEMMEWKKIVPDEEQFKRMLTDAKASAAQHGEGKPEDYEPDGSAYRQMEWEMKMRKLVAGYID